MTDLDRFWWLDLNTFIMEPGISLQSHLFTNLGKNTYRDINIYNPLQISHPLNDTWLDEETSEYLAGGSLLVAILGLVFVLAE